MQVRRDRAFGATLGAEGAGANVGALLRTKTADTRRTQRSWPARAQVECPLVDPLVRTRLSVGSPATCLGEVGVWVWSANHFIERF